MGLLGYYKVNVSYLWYSEKRRKNLLPEAAGRVYRGPGFVIDTATRVQEVLIDADGRSQQGFGRFT